MKIAAIILVGTLIGLATGCSSTPKTGNPVVQAQTRPAYVPATAAALAFDPPITSTGPLVDLTRDGRDARAFVGYEQPIIETGYVYQRDQQRGTPFDGNRFDRIAYSSKWTTISR